MHALGEFVATTFFAATSGFIISNELWQYRDAGQRLVNRYSIHCRSSSLLWHDVVDLDALLGLFSRAFA